MDNSNGPGSQRLKRAGNMHEFTKLAICVNECFREGLLIRAIRQIALLYRTSITR